eukprot:NODE_4469_length_780_cov_34.436447_g4446_i0.p1 GENE.NODE_4469_length_780_cov_34.436447_g4446_i0~~NODE_4469_length_780_cov_34.436447_g4446_i0.p1  ORF type:complete len:252 (-),score=69.18 NODE_4469_length_780_cov_34.436447_g4446_i0:23-691(-)
MAPGDEAPCDTTGEEEKPEKLAAQSEAEEQAAADSVTRQKFADMENKWMSHSDERSQERDQRMEVEQAERRALAAATALTSLPDVQQEEASALMAEENTAWLSLVLDCACTAVSVAETAARAPILSQHQHAHRSIVHAAAVDRGYLDARGTHGQRRRLGIVRAKQERRDDAARDALLRVQHQLLEESRANVERDARLTSRNLLQSASARRHLVSVVGQGGHL